MTACLYADAEPGLSMRHRASIAEAARLPSRRQNAVRSEADIHDLG